MAVEVAKRYVQHEGGFVFRPMEVIRACRVTPNMARVTFGGPEVRHVISLSADDDIRIQIPEDFDDTPVPPVVAFDPFRLVYPDNAPPSQIRAFTIRRLDHDAGELDLDFALHGEGISTHWAEQARPGQRVTIGGPRGSTVFDSHFDTWLFIGDATALPAIGRYIENFPSGTSATLVVEIDDPADEQVWVTASDVTVTAHWVHRHGALPGRNDLLENAVRTLPDPGPSCFVFAAGESATIRRLRRQVISDWDIDKRHINVAGYWKRDDDEHDYFVESELEAD